MSSTTSLEKWWISTSRRPQSVMWSVSEGCCSDRHYFIKVIWIWFTKTPRPTSSHTRSEGHKKSPPPNSSLLLKRSSRPNWKCLKFWEVKLRHLIWLKLKSSRWAKTSRQISHILRASPTSIYWNWPRSTNCANKWKPTKVNPNKPSTVYNITSANLSSSLIAVDRMNITWKTRKNIWYKNLISHHLRATTTKSLSGIWRSILNRRSMKK